MRLFVIVVLVAFACDTYAEDSPTKTETVQTSPAGPDVSASETQQPEKPFVDSLRLNFVELQETLARRLFTRSPLNLFSALAPPLVVADGFGLLVERNFGP